jgi:hypothetical protein
MNLARGYINLLVFFSLLENKGEVSQYYVYDRPPSIIGKELMGERVNRNRETKKIC